jgi:hypothetical protein
MFRALKPDEVEVRVGMTAATGFSLLLYKNARCDMAILDETVGPMNWQRHHTKDNANCVVALWCDNKKEWIEKEDTGTESNQDAEKGLASDSFKRACFNWGIGRELYTSPFIWVSVKEGDPKAVAKKFKGDVKVLEVKDGKIVDLVIVDGRGQEVYKMRRGSAPAPQKATAAKPAAGALTSDQVKFALAGVETLSQLREFYKAQAALGATDDVLALIQEHAKSVAANA